MLLTPTRTHSISQTISSRAKFESSPNTWDPNYTPGVDFLDHDFLSSKKSGQDLSNEGLNFILSSLEVGH